ncbi:metallophosphoesterase [Bailinhaonella thermotolerans]|uniref:Metallophosphoesterase n=1 Tax=Bailinhaonella thermotolerans TaxID=1070861 RepID=A0A3A4AW87_9ACTN|nr:metallophosphoesterase [Bailinhaonella thermotolerans]RJL34145.1 metallophosphoesterase [Bailinhaonella thermotolerans]
MAFLGLLAVFAAVLGMPVFLWWRLVRGTTRPGRQRRTLVVLGLIAAAALIALTAHARSLPPLEARAIVWPVSLAQGFLIFFACWLLLLEPARLLAALILRRRARSRTAARAASGPGTAVRPAVPGPGTAARRGTAGRGEPGEGEAATVGAARGAAGARREAGGQVWSAMSAPLGELPAGAADEPPPPAAGSAVPGPELDRRLFLGRSAVLVAGMAAAATTAQGVRSATGAPRIRSVPITLARLPGAFEGFRVAAVSDIHVGAFLGRRHTERIVRRINALRPDMIAIVGDLATGTPGELGPDAAPLRDLEAPHGVFYVLGNHETYFGPEEWAQEVASLGVRPLRNERVVLERAGAAIDLAGVDDVSGREMGVPGADLGRALGGRDPGRPVILLSHQPVLAREAAAHGVDLQLSGHTHGGQILPFGYLEALQQPVLSGLAEVGGTQVFVTNGAGFSDLPLRLGAPPEIALLELRPRP